MTLPTHLEADLADYDRGAFDEDFDRCMEFFAEVIRSGEIPYRLDKPIQHAITEGYLTPAGDVTMRWTDLEDHWHLAQLIDEVR